MAGITPFATRQMHLAGNCEGRRLPESQKKFNEKPAMAGVYQKISADSALNRWSQDLSIGHTAQLSTFQLDVTTPLSPRFTGRAQPIQLL